MSLLKYGHCALRMTLNEKSTLQRPNSVFSTMIEYPFKVTQGQYGLTRQKLNPLMGT